MPPSVHITSVTILSSDLEISADLSPRVDASVARTPLIERPLILIVSATSIYELRVRSPLSRQSLKLLRFS